MRCQARRRKGHVHVRRRSLRDYEAGDAYFAPPGHTPTIYAGTELVEFHPTDELAETVAVIERNMEQMGS